MRQNRNRGALHLRCGSDRKRAHHLRAVLPRAAAAPAEAETVARYHRCLCERCDAVLTLYSALVTLKTGELALSREYALDESED